MECCCYIYADYFSYPCGFISFILQHHISNTIVDKLNSYKIAPAQPVNKTRAVVKLTKQQQSAPE